MLAGLNEKFGRAKVDWVGEVPSRRDDTFSKHRAFSSCQRTSLRVYSQELAEHQSEENRVREQVGADVDETTEAIAFEVRES